MSDLHRPVGKPERCKADNEPWPCRSHLLHVESALKKRLSERDETIASLTADLEQARENLRLMTLAAKAESERADQLWRERNTAEACADGMQEVARGFEQERDAARRDIGRLRGALGLVVQKLDDVEQDGTDIAFGDNERDIIRDAFNRTTPTADPRDAVVSAARELAQGVREFAEDPDDDLILLCNLESELAKLDEAATPARGDS